ncbi:helix-turn-helix domain-containing protein [Kribbella sp. CA-293567]|uniref:helix-turn-helix domain-containing protein n=1 Tax=Kribbella sp. CA-293567 TaxID=3002436 RepID=UPI0022DDABA5|nr:helix-turn-helix domain-containing protein [Kribbella sp. CA-293567]WBQ04333.1 tyrosine-type recombinase/integrase [Kribbella sp. CA-293567]
MSEAALEEHMAKKPLPLGTWGGIWIKPVRLDAKGNPVKFQARANYRDYDGVTREIAAHGKTRSAAANKLRATLKVRTERGDYGGLKPTDRFSVGAERFMANLKMLVDEDVRAPGTYDTYRYQLTKNVLPRLGHIRFFESTTPLVNKAIMAIKDASGAASAKTCKSIISGIYALAVRDGAVTSNPVREIEIVSKVRRSPPRALTRDERNQWFELLSKDERAVRADLIDISKFMLATGERIGETLAVTWEDADLESGEVKCLFQIQRIAGKGLVRRRVKSSAGERVLLLPDWAVQMLKSRWVPGTPLESPIFPDSNGGFRDPHNVRRNLRDVRQPVGSARRQELGKVLRARRRRAGLTQDDVVSKLSWKKTRLSLIETGRVRLSQEEAITLADTYGLARPDRLAVLELTEMAGIQSLADELAWVTSHKFRKTTATILDDAGHSARQVADQLGHSRTSTTQDDYIGRKIRNPEAAKALDEALRSIHEQGLQPPEGPAQ